MQITLREKTRNIKENETNIIKEELLVLKYQK